MSADEDGDRFAPDLRGRRTGDGPRLASRSGQLEAGESARAGIGQGLGNPRLGRLLCVLADGETRSGDAIAAALGVNRTAVWKLVQQLREQFDLEIEAVRGRGYRLVEPLELLDPALLHAELGPATVRRLGCLEVFDTLGSTNSHLMDRARTEQSDARKQRGQVAKVGGPEDAFGHSAGTADDERRFDTGEVCLAERQTVGRGRLGRTWVSPYGRNLYLSVRWRYLAGPAELGGLSLACGVAVAKTLRALGAEGVGLKWPNDLHWRGRKLAGLLVEVAGEAQGPSDAVVGVGLNLRVTRAQAAQIDQPWTDLARVFHAEWSQGADAGLGPEADAKADSCVGRPAQMPSRHRIAAALIDALLLTLDRYRHDGLAPLLLDWPSLDLYRGEQVVLIAGNRRVTGTYMGIDSRGALLLALPDGRQQAFAAGEVSLRPHAAAVS